MVRNAGGLQLFKKRIKDIDELRASILTAWDEMDQRIRCFLKILKRCSLNSDDLLFFYTTVIRPILEYACPAWHNSLTNEQSRQIESVQKRALSIIFG